MYNITDVRSLHLEVTTNCQARCPMCPRRIDGVINPYLNITDVSLDQFRTWFPESFIKQLVHFFMCGNFGDPVVARDTLAIFKYVRELNPNTTMGMNTNGSARDSDWWGSIAQLGVVVTFGIDGLQDTHSLYRIGTDWNLVIKNATAFIKAGGKANWDMIVFKHNEHQVDKCKQLSEQLGFQTFHSKHTSRFRGDVWQVMDDEGNKLHVLQPTTRSAQMVSKVLLAERDVLPTITCKAVADSGMYVNASGGVLPCCWLDLGWRPIDRSPSKRDYMSNVGKFPNLNETTLQEVFESGYFNRVAACWTSTGLLECSKQCGKFDKLNEQF